MRVFLALRRIARRVPVPLGHVLCQPDDTLGRRDNVEPETVSDLEVHYSLIARSGFGKR